uniref:Uncharacterized protein n=1 Tax=Parascaris equorum TaxID=6256 RepID=A0A914REW5_PAREQ
MRQFAARATASNIGMHEVHPHAQFQARTLYAPSVMQSVQMGQLHANPEVQNSCSSSDARCSQSSSLSSGSDSEPHVSVRHHGADL